MSKYQALIDALKAPGLTDCPWEACGPSHGAALPIYCNEVVAVPENIDDDASGEVVCRAPLGLDDECSADMAYIAAANPATIRALLADLEMAEKALKAVAEWGPFPRVPDSYSDEPGATVSYAVAFGSNGERDYIRGIAQVALAQMAGGCA